MKAVKILVLIVAIILMIVSAAICIANNISLRNQIEGPKDRAQVAADAQEIHDRLVELDQKMEERGMTYGYTRLWERSPWTNVKEIRDNIKRLIGRTETIAQMDKSSAAYQVGLDDVRGTLRELNVQAWGWWIWADSGWVWLCLMGPLAMIAAIIAAITIWGDNLF